MTPELADWSVTAPTLVAAIAVFGVGNGISKAIKVGAPGPRRTRAAELLEVGATIGPGLAAATALASWWLHDGPLELAPARILWAVAGYSLFLICLAVAGAVTAGGDSPSQDPDNDDAPSAMLHNRDLLTPGANQES